MNMFPLNDDLSLAKEKTHSMDHVSTHISRPVIFLQLRSGFFFFGSFLETKSPSDSIMPSRQWCQVAYTTNFLLQDTKLLRQPYHYTTMNIIYLLDTCKMVAKTWPFHLNHQKSRKNHLITTQILSQSSSNPCCPNTIGYRLSAPFQPRPFGGLPSDRLPTMFPRLVPNGGSTKVNSVECVGFSGRLE